MNIKSIKESIQGYSQEKDLINRFLEKDIECAIDEQTDDCAVMEEEPAYTGIPAPTVLQMILGFGPAVVSDANKDYMERSRDQATRRRESSVLDSKESENIHQMMYEMATNNAATTLQLDPIGGSENFQGVQKMSIDDWRYSDHKMKVGNKHLRCFFLDTVEKWRRVNLNTPVNQSTSVFTIGSLKAT